MIRPPPPHRRDLWVAGLLSVFVGGPSVAMLLIAGPGPGRSVPAIAALVLAHAALAYRRTWPIMAFALVTASFAVLAAATGMFVTLPSALVFPFALYSACAYGGRLVTLAALVVVLLGAGDGTLRLATDPATADSGALPKPGMVFARHQATLTTGARPEGGLTITVGFAHDISETTTRNS